jgi:uncharacterized Zn finger protein
MSDAAGAQAVSAVSSGKVRELPHARTFAVESSGGDDVYLVTLAVVAGSTALGGTCTCEAGRRGRSCWHVRAAHLMARDDSPAMRRARGLEPIRPAHKRERA